MSPVVARALELHRRRVALRRGYEALEVQLELDAVLRGMSEDDAAEYFAAWERERDAHLRALVTEARAA